MRTSTEADAWKTVSGGVILLLCFGIAALLQADADGFAIGSTVAVILGIFIVAVRARGREEKADQEIARLRGELAKDLERLERDAVAKRYPGQETMLPRD